MNKYLFNRVGSLTLLMLAPHFAAAQSTITYTENFNGTTLSDITKTWSAINGACLTASTSNTTSVSSNPVGTIPGCVTSSGFSSSNANSYYKGLGSGLVGGATGAALPDASGSGVLRLTNGAASSMSSTNGNNETGAFILANPFPSSNGINITYTTYTWGGNAYANSNSVKSGADGIAFFLLDASKYQSGTLTTSTVIPVTKTGAYGGSLGYDCSYGKYTGTDSSTGDGIIGAYVGVGVDEFGNFINSGDNANYAEAASPGQTPNTIGVRGGGNVNVGTFSTSGGLPTGNNPGLGPIVQAQYVCKYGYYTTSATSSTTVTTNTVNTSSVPALHSVVSATPNAVVAGSSTTTGYSTVTWVSAVTSNSYTTTTGKYPVQAVFDFPILAHKTLAQPIFNQEYTSNPFRFSTSTATGATPIKYYISLTAAGVMSLSYSYAGGVYTPVMVNQSIVPTGGTLPANFLFGFTSGTGGGSNNHEISCFSAAQPVVGSGSAGGNIPQGEKVLAGNQIYVASYNPLYWTGTVQADYLSVNATTGAVAIANVPGTSSPIVWDAGCVLSGTGSCATSPSVITTPPARAIAAWNDGIAAGGTAPTTTGKGVAFTMSNFSNLSGNEQQMLNCGTPTGTGTACDNYGAQRIAFLVDNNTGTGEAGPTGANAFRTRISMLGDMINSSPLWVGNPNLPYTSTFVDNLSPGTAQPELSTYYTSYQSSFSGSTNGGRLNVVYVGANDGMVHGFAAGYGDVNNGTSSTDNTGQEVMAFLPSLAVSTIHNLVNTTGELDYTNQLYAHNDYVDAPAGYGDLFWSSSNTWQTWLVGGLGGGGNVGGVIGGTVASGTISSATATNGVGEIYAINISNPITPSNIGATSGATVAANVMGDWTTNSIKCTSTVNITDTCNLHMGSTYGTPSIRRLHTGNWAIIFGNGLNSADGTAGIFIIEVTGTPTAPTYIVHYIDTGAGASSDPTGQGNVNGIAYATPADLDGDHITDYVYAGDVLGNVWRFDLTSSSSSNWTKPVKIFTASTSTLLQPITTAVIAATIPYNGAYGIVINFGTGRQLQQTLTSAAGYSPSAQNLYGVWDWNMASWNALNSTQFYSAPSGITSGIGNLTQETLSAYTSGTIPGFTLSNATVCYAFMIDCTGSPNPSYGWYITPSVAQEQFIYNPTLYQGILYINSYIPPTQQSQSANCTTPSATGYTYAVNPATGNFTGEAVFGLNGVGTPFFVQSAVGTTGTTLNTLITQTIAGVPSTFVPQCQGASCSSTSASTRLTWVELR